MKLTKQEFLEHISKTPFFTARFLKKNGEKRILNGCLDYSYIESVIGPNKKTIKESDSSDDYVRVWDVENKGWRTIILSSIENIQFSE